MASIALAGASASSAAGVPQHFDLVVIGGGSGGLAAAKEAAKLHPGKKVLCLDHVTPSVHGTKWGLGGTCVNAGCIPKKICHHAGNIGALLQKDAEEYGWQGVGDAAAANIKHSWPALRQLTGDYIHSLNFAYTVGLRSAGVTYVDARAVFDSPNSLVHTTNSGKVTHVTFDRAIVSTGGRPISLPIPGAQLAITSDDLFWLKQSPGTTLIIGGGYIALETASFLHNIGGRAFSGKDVSVMVRGPILRKMDQQCAEMVGELMERDGVRFLQGVPLSIRSTGGVQLPAHSVAHPSRAGWHSLDNDAKDNVRWVEQSSGVVQTIFHKPAGLITYAPFDATVPLEVSWKRIEDGVIHIVTEFFDTVVFATGRMSMLSDLGLDKAGVQIHQSSTNPKILTDNADVTTNPRIFAIGDVATGVPQHVLATSAAAVAASVVGSVAAAAAAAAGASPLVVPVVPTVPVDRPELTPVAIQAGQLLARRLWGKEEQLASATSGCGCAAQNHALMNYDLVATTIFTTPSEYAFLGLSEEHARRTKEQGGIGNENVEVYWSRFGNLEISPLHPHLPEQRSTVFTDRSLWHKRYAESRGLAWPEVTFSPDGMNSNVLYRAAIGEAEVLAVVREMKSDAGKVKYTISLDSDADDRDKLIREVSGKQLRLSEDARVENAELFYKANALCKLVVDTSRHELVVGLHFIGPNAGEVVQGFALGISLGATKAHFDRLVGIHPTAAEEFTVLNVKQSEGQTLLKQAGCGGGSCG